MADRPDLDEYGEPRSMRAELVRRLLLMGVHQLGEDDLRRFPGMVRKDRDAERDARLLQERLTDERRRLNRRVALAGVVISAVAVLGPFAGSLLAANILHAPAPTTVYVPVTPAPSVTPLVTPALTPQPTP